jgi:hypothetical protein
VEAGQVAVVDRERALLLLLHLVGLQNVVAKGLPHVLDAAGVGFVVGIVVLELEPTNVSLMSVLTSRGTFGTQRTYVRPLSWCAAGRCACA